jgi:hypothetical protein
MEVSKGVRIAISFRTLLGGGSGADYFIWLRLKL